MSSNQAPDSDTIKQTKEGDAQSMRFYVYAYAYPDSRIFYIPFANVEPAH